MCKKVLSVILCMCMLFGLCAVPSFAADVCDCDELPIVYVRGRSTVYKDKYTREVDLPDISDEEIKNRIKPMLSLLAKGYFSGDYTEYGNALANAFKELYADFSPDSKGNFPGNSGNYYDPAWSYRDIHRNIPAEGDYEGATRHLMEYTFEYDFRSSPWDIADDLLEYITNIKRITGHSRINVVARCLGSCIASAYFAKYGWSDINSVVMYNPTCNGTIVTNALFTGNLALNIDSVNYFVGQNVETDDTLYKFLISSLDMLNSVYGLRLTAAALSSEVNKIAAACAPACTRASYGTMGGYWAMVGPEYYEKARAYVFPGEYAEEYKAIIEKTDLYYYNVAAKLPEMFKAMAADGVNMKFIAKYGLQAYPLSDEAQEQSDMIISVRQQTFGASSAKMGKKFSYFYLREAKKNGTDKYISADNTVDCSTALFPDSTWLIKDFTHNCFPPVVDVMILKLLENGGRTAVWDNESYPQYLVINKEADTLTPLTAENPGSQVNDGFAATLMTYLSNLMEILMKVLDVITGIFDVIKA